MKIVNAMTVDVEDYFQVSAFERVVARDRWPEYESRVAANTDRLLGIFAEFGVRATFFVLGWAAERDGSIVRRIGDAGHEVASHGYGHRLVYDQTPETFREDVRRARRVLQDLSGQPVNGYRAPSFSITERSLWALDVLVEEGYTYDTSIFPIRHDRYGIPGAPRHPFWVGVGRGSGAGRPFPPPPAVDSRGLRRGLAEALRAKAGRVASDNEAGLLEIPASTIRIAGLNLPVAGGGYFRLLPYWWTRFGIRRLNEVEGKPAVFYMHPWELDPDQPRLAGSALSRFRHYRNLSRTEARLRRLLSDVRFGTISSAVLGSWPVSVSPPSSPQASLR
jgi:polysaccharide deacetylase family protein (PEP-CTERM system associated)